MLKYSHQIFQIFFFVFFQCNDLSSVFDSLKEEELINKVPTLTHHFYYLYDFFAVNSIAKPLLQQSWDIVYEAFVTICSHFK
jgi:hypothetical protein